jgi:hypothetical protein
VDGQTTLNVPIGLAVGPDGHVYVGDRDNDRVTRFAPAPQAGFVVSLSVASAAEVRVNFATSNGTAIAGSDYVAGSGVVTFAPGETTRTVLIPVIDDALSEGPETFTVGLSNPVGATIADGQATGTITDDEPARVLSVGVNDGAAQRSRVTSLTITFDRAVTFGGGAANAAAAFALTRVTGAGGAVGLAAAVSTNAVGQTVVVLTFTGTAAIDPASLQNGGPASLADGRYRLTVLDGLVTSSDGQALDGDGNGTAGGSYQTADESAGPGPLRLYRLFGDATGDGGVDLVDLAALRGSFNATSGSAAYLDYLDANNTGTVDLVDLAEFRGRFNQTVF